MNGLMCVRDVDGDSKSFAAMDMLPFSTTSAAGHEVQVGNCLVLCSLNSKRISCATKCDVLTVRQLG